MEEIVGSGTSEPVIAVGGGSRTETWLKVKAAVTNRTLGIPSVVEAGALGAALVGGLAVGRFEVASEVAGLESVTWREVRPDADHVRRYAAVSRDYRSLFARPAHV
jgi:sugar (pentulose or hexulose) kinase